MPRGVKELTGRKPMKDRIIMVQRARPKIVRLPNGRTFEARYKRAMHADLPANINFPRVYKQRAAPKGKRRVQREGSIKSKLKKALNVVKKVVKNPTFKSVAKMAIAKAPGAVAKLSTKVKNKRLRSLLVNDMTKTGLDLAAGYAMDKLDNYN